ncbi:MAG: hypothetical protein JXM70_04220 [Pirellulales bacterium]|nr:hypothetical protein [Pirellulales bacterium]
MELKNAVAVCFISLFAATLVVLIARALDIQAASKIQPELQKISADLEALREQISGGSISVKAGNASTSTVSDGLAVYYAHGNVRCPTCEAIESQAHQAVTSGFADELKNGKVSWEMVNYEEPAGKRFRDEYGVHMATVVLVRMKNGKPDEWKRLDEVWGLYTDKPECIKFIQAEMRKLLEPAAQPEPESSNSEAQEPPADLPLPLPAIK